MSETPITDSAERLNEPDGPWVRSSTARDLEKKLTAAQEHAERLREALENIPGWIDLEHLAAVEAGIVRLSGDAVRDIGYIQGICQEALAAPSGQRSPWLPIESAPRDGTMFIGRKGDYVAPTKLGKYYEKWPHEEGGPTYRYRWDNCQSDSVSPWHPTHWMPLPSAPETIAQEGTS